MSSPTWADALDALMALGSDDRAYVMLRGILSSDRDEVVESYHWAHNELSVNPLDKLVWLAELKSDLSSGDTGPY